MESATIHVCRLGSYIFGSTRTLTRSIKILIKLSSQTNRDRPLLSLYTDEGHRLVEVGNGSTHAQLKENRVLENRDFCTLFSLLNVKSGFC